MKTNILVVDDDPNIRDVIGFALEKAGFTVSYAVDGAGVAERVEHGGFDLLVLDIGLPEQDGIELCREIRKTSDLPIVFLTARDDEIDRILGLEIGGDDYVTKPFSPRELVARVKVILRRSAGGDVQKHSRKFVQGALELDGERHRAWFSQYELSLTASEFSLLLALMARPDNVLTRGQLMDAVYGPNVVVADRTIDSHLRNIRAKFAALGCENVVETVHGVGLRMGKCLPQ